MDMHSSCRLLAVAAVVLNMDLYGDITPPRPLRALLVNPGKVTIAFSEPLMRQSATRTFNYSFGWLPIRGVSLQSNGTRFDLAIDPIDLGYCDYQVFDTLTISQVADTSGVYMATPVALPLELHPSVLIEFYQGIAVVTQQLGCIISSGVASFNLFAPRIQSATLELYSNASDTRPFRAIPMMRDTRVEKDPVTEPLGLPGRYRGSLSYVWTARFLASSVPHGTFYKYNIVRNGNQMLVSDPYAKANVHSGGKSIVIWPGVNDPPFEGWTDTDYATPPPDELVVYEAHVANLSGCNPVVSDFAHKYLALTVDEPGSPLRHIIDLGVNALELLPLHEFANGASLDFSNHYSWGYMPSLFLAPESSFSTDPAARRQVSELKTMINVLHARGIAVIVDVVFNHASNEDNHLAMVDYDFYFTGRNDSGSSNTLYCSRPMVRKLMLDSLRHLVSEYHVDGFRFDLSHLIDQTELLTPDNMRMIEQAKPTQGRLIWIAANGSWNRADIMGRGIAQWNDWFREDIKEYVSKGQRRDTLPRRIAWSKDRNAYATPLETVNYVESHDEDTIVNRLARAGICNPDIIAARAQMAALILLTSQGIPMILAGQEFLRNAPAQEQSYTGNMLDWSLAQTNAATVAFFSQLIALRREYPVLRAAKDEGNGFHSVLSTSNQVAYGYVINANNAQPTQPRFAVLANPGFAPATFTLPDNGWARLADHNGFTDPPMGVDNTVVVPPNEFALLIREPTQAEDAKR